jgi:hypothetical protein
MDIGGILAVVMTAGALYAVTLLVARGPETLRGGLFHAEQLGWPHGVQEDDDVRWRWAASPGAMDRRHPGPEPEPRDLEPRDRDDERRDPPGPVRVQPLRPVLRLRDQARSEARARS